MVEDEKGFGVFASVPKYNLGARPSYINEGEADLCCAKYSATEWSIATLYWQLLNRMNFI
jgi:hypothetical protein